MERHGKAMSRRCPSHVVAQSSPNRRPDPLGEAPARGGAQDAALEPRLAELAQDPGAQNDTILTFENLKTPIVSTHYQIIIILMAFQFIIFISWHIRDHTSEASDMGAFLDG